MNLQRSDWLPKVAATADAQLLYHVYHSFPSLQGILAFINSISSVKYVCTTVSIRLPTYTPVMLERGTHLPCDYLLA